MRLDALPACIHPRGGNLQYQHLPSTYTCFLITVICFCIVEMKNNLTAACDHHTATLCPVTCILDPPVQNVMCFTIFPSVT